MTATYGIIKDTYREGASFRVSYGIAAYSAKAEGKCSIILSVHDITSDKERIEALVCLCNRNELSSIHLRDVVEDFICE